MFPVHCSFESANGNKCWIADGLGCGGYCLSHCPVGIKMTADMRVASDLNKLTPEFIDKLWRRDEDHYVEHHGAERQKKTHKGNGAPLGAFAFTLTKSPMDDLTEFDMIRAVRKIMSQKSCPVVRYAWYLEYKENNTHPHIHGMYETVSLGRIEKKHWKRAWPIWDENHKLGNGFRGGYHRPVRVEEIYKDYIQKDKGRNEWYNIDGMDVPVEAHHFED